MTTMQIIEVAIAALLIGAGIRRQVRTRRSSPNRGSQTAVILIVIGALIAIHGLGLMEYRPSRGEMERAAARMGNR
jgi:uncharacterized membrane protein HdeD (DUF308 family)